MKKRFQFRTRLEKPEIVVAPGAYDCLSAKLIAAAGFEAVYVSGAAVAASLCGFPDVGLVGMSEMADCVRRIAGAVDLPVLADADTGYGNALNVQRTVRELEGAGACAIHLEDQEMPKRCGHLEGKRVVSPGEMVGKIRAALDARRDPDFLIIARTDARATSGLEEALERARAYGEAGADVLFVEAPESEEELALIGRSFSKPLLVNRGGDKKTPWLGARELQQLGFRIVIFPGDLQRAAGRAMGEAAGRLKETGNNTSYQDRMMGFMERFNLLGLKDYREAEKKYLAGE